MLNKEQIKMWSENGYCITNYKNIEQLLEARSFIYKNNLSIRSDFGSELEFPYKNLSLNKITLNIEIIKTVKELLKTNEILLTQSTAWIKTGPDGQLINSDKNKGSNDDQRMHMDFPNHNILVPSSFDNPDVVSIIIYLDNDHDLDNQSIYGHTHIVPKTEQTLDLYQDYFTESSGLSNRPWINDKVEAERYFFKNDRPLFNLRKKLYTSEIAIPYKIGTVLFYRHDVWHRGSSLKINKTRALLNLCFKKKNIFYIHSWNKGPARSMYDHSCVDVGSFEKLLVLLNEEQRALIGFPDLNDKYWTIDNIIQVMARYNFDKKSTLYLDLQNLLNKKQQQILNKL